MELRKTQVKSLNPLKRVNSILTLERATETITSKLVSQSPQTGQFNSYILDALNGIAWNDESQSPQTGQFNSYERNTIHNDAACNIWSQSPQTGQFNSYKIDSSQAKEKLAQSQSPQTGQFNSYKIDSSQAKEKLAQSQSPQTGQFNSYRVIHFT